MKALVFGVPPEPFEVPDDANTLTQNLVHSPVGLRDIPDPQPLHDDWVVTRPRLTGICGSDSKQILLVQAGVVLGANWTQIRHALQPFDLAIAVLVVTAGLLFIWWRLGMPGWNRVRGRSEPTSETSAGPKEGAEGGQ